MTLLIQSILVKRNRVKYENSDVTLVNEIETGVGATNTSNMKIKTNCGDHLVSSDSAVEMAVTSWIAAMLRATHLYTHICCEIKEL